MKIKLNKLIHWKLISLFEMMTNHTRCPVVNKQCTWLFVYNWIWITWWQIYFSLPGFGSMLARIKFRSPAAGANIWRDRINNELTNEICNRQAHKNGKCHVSWGLSPYTETVGWFPGSNIESAAGLCDGSALTDAANLSSELPTDWSQIPQRG